jgi:hypothetical protein
MCLRQTVYYILPDSSSTKHKSKGKTVKKNVFILIAFGIAFFSQYNVSAQTGKITRLHAGSSDFFTSVAAAISASVDGDTLYLPGGPMDPTPITIDKKLAIIGAGHYPDSTAATNPTFFSSAIYIVTGADHGSLSGCICDRILFGTSEANQNINTYLIERCRINYLQLAQNNNPASTSSNIAIIENVILSIIDFSGGSSVLFEKNIFRYCYSQSYCDLYYSATATFNNNIFDNTHLIWGNGYNFSRSFNSVYNNNIFISPGNGTIILSTSCIYNHNLFCATGETGPDLDCNIYFTCNGNISGQTTSDTFMNYTGGWNYNTSFSYANDYHLKPTSPGKNAGNDGNDIGIYGTFYPYKESAVPANPHIGFKNISPATNASGTLPVDIKVSAQER